MQITIQPGSIRCGCSRQDGAIIRISLYPARNLPGWAPPNGLAIDALIDTGASGSCLDSRLVRTLGLVSTGFQLVSTGGGLVTNQTPGIVPGTAGCAYHLRVRFSTGTEINNWRVGISSLPQQSYQCILGREILEYGELVYHGKTGRAIFTFLR